MHVRHGFVLIPNLTASLVSQIKLPNTATTRSKGYLDVVEQRFHFVKHFVRVVRALLRFGFHPELWVG